MREIKNATAGELYLGGWEQSVPSPGKGMFTSHLPMQWGGGGVSFGGYNLGGIFTDYYIRSLLNVLGVSEVAKLPGTKCRVILDRNVCIGIGHWDEDKWFTKEEIDRWVREEM